MPTTAEVSHHLTSLIDGARAASRVLSDLVESPTAYDEDTRHVLNMLGEHLATLAQQFLDDCATATDADSSVELPEASPTGYPGEVPSGASIELEDLGRELACCALGASRILSDMAHSTIAFDDSTPDAFALLSAALTNSTAALCSVVH